MNWQTGILNAALFASLSGCCIQAALTHNWKLTMALSIIFFVTLIVYGIGLNWLY